MAKPNQYTILILGSTNTGKSGLHTCLEEETPSPKHTPDKQSAKPSKKPSSEEDTPDKQPAEPSEKPSSEEDTPDKQPAEPSEKPSSEEYTATMEIQYLNKTIEINDQKAELRICDTPGNIWDIPEGYNLALMSELNGADPSQTNILYLGKAENGGIDYVMLAKDGKIYRDIITYEELERVTQKQFDQLNNKEIKFFNEIKMQILCLTLKKHHTLLGNILANPFLKMRDLTLSYCRMPDAIIFCCNLTDRHSFDTLDACVALLHAEADKNKKNATPIFEENTPIFLVGTRSDRTEGSPVTADELKSKAEALCCQASFTVSAKTGENVQETFKQITSILLEKAKEKRKKEAKTLPVNTLRTKYVNNGGGWWSTGQIFGFFSPNSQDRIILELERRAQHHTNGASGKTCKDLGIK